MKESRFMASTAAFTVCEGLGPARPQDLLSAKHDDLFLEEEGNLAISPVVFAGQTQQSLSNGRIVIPLLF